MNNNGITVKEVPSSYHPVLRIFAKIISIIFHPLFIPVYILLFVLYISPVTVGLDSYQKGRLTISFSMMYVLFPLVTVLLAKGLGFIDNIYLRSQKDRIIPYIACGVYYFWMWYVLHNQSDFPKQLTSLSLAIFLASSAGLLVNSWMRVSMHAIAAGTAAAFMYMLAVSSVASFGFYLSVALLIAGLICTARLINNDHNPAEVYSGFFIGILTQLIAAWFS